MVRSGYAKGDRARVNYIVKIIGTIVVTIAILGLPVLTCLSFVFDWHVFIRFVLLVAFTAEATVVACGVYERSEDE